MQEIHIIPSYYQQLFNDVILFILIYIFLAFLCFFFLYCKAVLMKFRILNLKIGTECIFFLIFFFFKKCTFDHWHLGLSFAKNYFNQPDFECFFCAGNFYPFLFTQSPTSRSHLALFCGCLMSVEKKYILQVNFQYWVSPSVIKTGL